MKAIQVMFDERLLKVLDSDPDVRREGRSAVLRRAAEEYLHRKRATEIRDSYRKAYAGGKGLASELGGWEDEGVWPGE